MKGIVWLMGKSNSKQTYDAFGSIYYIDMLFLSFFSWCFTLVAFLYFRCHVSVIILVVDKSDPRDYYYRVLQRSIK